MKNKPMSKHDKELPSARKIRRSCQNELYRTIKRLNVWIPEKKVREAETLYYHKVVMNLPWVHENGDNRKKLADWFTEEVGPEIAEIWDIPIEKLEKSFRDAFGGF